jgi:hypothetical protein
MASHGEYDPFNFFDVLDLLVEEGMDLGDDLPADEPTADAAATATGDGEATAAAETKKWPVTSFRERYVYPYRPLSGLSSTRNPAVREILERVEAIRKKSWAESRQERLEYLKNAR